MSLRVRFPRQPALELAVNTADHGHVLGTAAIATAQPLTPQSLNSGQSLASPVIETATVLTAVPLQHGHAASQPSVTRFAITTERLIGNIITTERPLAVRAA